jgi:hypothetical protein
MEGNYDSTPVSVTIYAMTTANAMKGESVSLKRPD